MMRLIDADSLRERMYNDAFETDSDMQKWDGGCWIRYKMFENALNDAPTVDSIPVVLCKDCRNYDENRWCSVMFTYPDDYRPYGMFYCAMGERKNDGVDC